MRKCVWVVAVDDYQPEICKKTLPNIEAYAKKIGATFQVIKERRWTASPTYEKLQVHELGRDNDWNIIIDADMLIDDKMHDPTAIVSSSMVASWLCYDARTQFPSDVYFFRDGRNIGASTNFLFVPANCHDALTPFDEAELTERKNLIKRPFILDEYCVSRNIAKFGLKFCGILSDLKNPPFQHMNINSGADSYTVV